MGKYFLLIAGTSLIVVGASSKSRTTSIPGMTGYSDLDLSLAWYIC